MSMDTIIEDDESFVSNTNATIYGASYISVRTESLISGSNIPNSSSTSEDDCYQQQQISTAAGGGGGGDDTTDDLIVSSCASSNWFTNNINNNKQGEVRIFNVDFRALLSKSPTQPQNYFAQANTSSFRMFRSDNFSTVQLFPTRYRRENMLNRSIAFSRKLYNATVPELFLVHQLRFISNASMIKPTPIKPWGFPPIQVADKSKVIAHERQIMNHQQSSSSFRFRWTAFLHNRFVQAVELLGGHERADPKSILELMDIQDLKLIFIKSHLQMYRAVKNAGAMKL
ncbi:uncharacterized protein LOC129880783 isoform X1 [Solanum dulcamara]|uniref:uncharacterized protein LOC129880783 isoform X1 n=1 Tax=Solanum dulcamara TaxID=45834 RepID=UPI0024858594|nr:uncharacterized protein LOC129880783 isoform X1 [Solanum dulcamara]